MRRVVAALQDPDPRVNGRGFALLRGAGIQVTLLGGRAAQLAKRQNAPFLKAVTRGLPYITYKAAHSLDGTARELRPAHGGAVRRSRR